MEIVEASQALQLTANTLPGCSQIAELFSCKANREDEKFLKVHVAFLNAILHRYCWRIEVWLSSVCHQGAFQQKMLMEWPLAMCSYSFLFLLAQVSALLQEWMCVCASSGFGLSAEMLFSPLSEPAKWTPCLTSTLLASLTYRKWPLQLFAACPTFPANG